MSFRVPTVDIGAWVAGGSDKDRERAAHSIDTALRESTLVRIVGHGIPDSIIAGLGLAIDELFALDLESKKKLIVEGRLNRGYTPANTETLSATLGMTGAAPDYFEAFNVGIPGFDYPHAMPTGPEYAESVWPDIPDFRRRIDLYFDEAGRVSRTVNAILARALGLEPAALDAITDHSVDTLRLNYYDERNRHSDQARAMNAHTDYGITTTAWIDPLPGLQVVGRDRAWHDVIVAEGGLLVMVGDLLGRLTNDRWRPTLHRVVQPVVDGRVETRRSVMFFHDGNSDAVITPRIGPGETAEHAPVTVADHIASKLAASRTGTPYLGAQHELDRLPAEQ